MPRKLIFVHPSSARVFPQGTDGQFYSFLVPSFNPIWVPCAGKGTFSRSRGEGEEHSLVAQFLKKPDWSEKLGAKITHWLSERSRRILIGWKVEVAWLEDGLEDDIILL